MRQQILLEATGSTLAILLNTDDLAKLFGSRIFAVNINSIKVFPLTFGTAVAYYFLADTEQSTGPEEGAGGGSTTYNEAQLEQQVLGDLLGSTGALRRVPSPGYKTVFRFTTADIAPQTEVFSAFPIQNNLVIGWDVDVDCVISFDFTILGITWNMREEIMRLLDGKRIVEDPNISNVLGKRAVRRAPLFAR